MPRRVGGVAAAETAVARRPPSDASLHAYPPCRGSSALQSPLGWAVGSASAWELRKHKKRAFGYDTSASYRWKHNGRLLRGTGDHSRRRVRQDGLLLAQSVAQARRSSGIGWHGGTTVRRREWGAHLSAQTSSPLRTRKERTSMHARTRTRPRIPTASMHACSMQARARSQEAGSPHPSAGT